MGKNMTEGKGWRRRRGLETDPRPHTSFPLSPFAPPSSLYHPPSLLSSAPLLCSFLPPKPPTLAYTLTFLQTSSFFFIYPDSCCSYCGSFFCPPVSFPPSLSSSSLHHSEYLLCSSLSFLSVFIRLWLFWQTHTHTHTHFPSLSKVGKSITRPLKDYPSDLFPSFVSLSHTDGLFFPIS